MRTLVTLGTVIVLYAAVAVAQQTPPGPDTLGSYPGSVHSQPPAGQKTGKSKAKNGQPAANNHAKNHARQGTARKHTPPAADGSLPRWTEPSDDQPDAVTPPSKALVLIKA